MAETYLSRVRLFIGTLPETSEQTSFGHPFFKAGKKTFATAGLDGPGPLPMSFKVGHDLQDILLQDPRFTRTHYVGQHGWVSTEIESDDDLERAKKLLLHGYRLVALKRMLAALDSGS